jgi:chorismate lyase/3-hydroxybenzoate synthase
MRALRTPVLVTADAPPIRPVPPAWVEALVSEDPSCALLSRTLLHPPDGHADAFAEAIAVLYRSIAEELARSQRHAVRIWNFVGDIQGPIDGAGDRYMAFNEGRFNAYADWFGGAPAFDRTVPTSSAVGISEDLFAMHVLAAAVPGEHVENPRQIPSYKYSRQYGFRPPCFARATRLPPRLLIGGTASILGEHSQHGGDLEAQTRETFQNLAALLAAAEPTASRRPLEALRSLRVHVRDAADGAAVRSLVDELAPHVADIEVVHSPLCRKELLVEIEGVAELHAS